MKSDMNLSCSSDSSVKCKGDVLDTI